MMPQGWAFQRPWEDWFTVVQWDQRGAGRTYLENAPQTVSPTLDIERYVDDTVALIALLRERYGKRKVILVGHSWGTVVGLKAALKRPEWIHAYVGISQVIDFQENERLGYEFALAAAQRDGNDAAIDELRALAPYPGDGALTIERIARQRRWVQHYGGLAAYRDNAGYYAAVPQLSPEYDAAALDAIGKGSALTLSRVLDELAGVDFTRVTEVSFPVVVFMGRHDYMVPSQPAAAWLNALKAPAKRGVWFEHSAHLAMFEEPGRVLVALVNDVLPLAREERAR